MTDEPDPKDNDLSPDEEDEVRRLLAEAGGPVPTPPDVVARLDATLARLVAERVEEPREATVTPLVVRRRRWPKLLLAAAAVVVGGYGLGAAVTGSMSGSMSGSGDSASAGGGSGSSAADGSEGAVSSARQPRQGTQDTSGPVPQLSSGDFAADVARVVAAAPTAEAPTDRPDSGAGKGEVAGKDELQAARRGRCAAPPSRKQDTWRIVRYDGRVATLVVGPARSGVARARVFSCDGTTLLRDSTVPVQ